MGQTPKLEEVIEAAIAERLNSFVTATVARVTAYEPDTQRADIEIVIVNQEQGQDGNPVSEGWPSVSHVPVIFPGSGAVRATFPINEGDWVLYVVTTLPIAYWFKSGGPVVLAESSQSKNHKRSGFVIPGLFTSKEVPTETPMDAYTIHGDVKLGDGQASELLALKKDLLNLRLALQNAVIAPGAGGASSVVAVADLLAAGGTLPPGSVTTPGAWPEGTTKVKAK